LYISHVASDLNEVREAVKLLTFDDPIVNGILESNFKGKEVIEKFILENGQDNDFFFQEQLSDYAELRNAVMEKDKSNTLALLNWVGKHAPKFDIIIYLMP